MEDAGENQLLLFSQNTKSLLDCHASVVQHVLVSQVQLFTA